MPDTRTEASASEIRAALKALGLEPGAAVEDVHAAFRRLVRECHPDIAGQKETKRFQEITGAYSILKNLSTEDLSPEDGVHGGKGRNREDLFDWYSKRRRGQLDDSQDARPRASGMGRRVDRVLEQYERDIARRLEQIAREATQVHINGFMVRLRSSVPEVRSMALSRLGPLVNNESLHSALANLLCRGNITEEMGRTLYSLPMSQDTVRSIAGKIMERSPSIIEGMTKHSSPAVRLLGRAFMTALGQPA